jgi:hypothetical protein
MLTARNLRLRFALSRRAAARHALRLLPAAALVVLSTACSDVSTTAPATAQPSVSAPSFAFGPGSTSATDPKTETFVYDGQDRTQSFGEGHKVHFDANSVCDPNTSGYGPGMWDLPCKPAQGPITFTVTSWRNADGRPRVSFSPDVRFVPGTNQVLYLTDAAPGVGKKATILWCSPLLPAGCVDESLTDSTLTTWVANGAVARRIKHFSGYNVTFGFADGISDGY